MACELSLRGVLLERRRIEPGHPCIRSHGESPLPRHRGRASCAETDAMQFYGRLGFEGTGEAPLDFGHEFVNDLVGGNLAQGLATFEEHGLAAAARHAKVGV